MLSEWKKWVDWRRESLIKSIMNRVAVKFEMIARRIAQVVVILRSQAMQQSKHSNLTQPLMALVFAGGLRCHATR
jgi:hypothetical protein